MPYIPVSVEEFGGLNARDDPTEVGLRGAVDLLNVDLDRVGRVRTRAGWSLVGALAAATLAPAKLAYFNSTGTGAEFVIARTNVGVTTPYNITSNIAGTTVATEATTSNGYARFGDTTNTRLYLADGSTTLQRFNGTAWTGVSTGTFNASSLAITPNDNRLVVADGSGTTGFTLAFSDAGAPETFGVNNFVRVHPGDGEYLTGLVTWRDYVFAFKQSKFYVFYGTSTDSAGNPVFNYRTVNVGRGCYGLGGVVAGSEGVYFADRYGIYVTTGDTPRYISRPIEGLLNGSVTLSGATFSLAGANQTGPTMTYYDRRLYVSDITNGTTLVYDPALDAWMVWSMGVAGMTFVPSTSTSAGLYFGNSATKKLAIIAGTTDNASAITWLYQTGYSDVGGYFRGAQTKAAERKLLRMVDILGTGTVTHQVLALNSRPNDVADTGGSVTLGVSPLVARGNRRRTSRGTFFAHKLSGSGVMSVSKLTHWISGVGSDT